MVLLQQSVCHVGDGFASVPIEAYVSPDRDTPDREWVDHLESLGIEWIDVDQRAFDAHSYAAATELRFCRPTGHDVIVLADADLFFTGSIGDAVATCAEDEAVLGVTAYRTPFTETSYPERASLGELECWSDLFAKLNLASPRFTSTHPAGYEEGWADDVSRCPPYFNFGMVFVPSRLAADIGHRFIAELPAVRDVFSGMHSAQIALSTSLHRSKIDSKELPLRYNFPNQLPYIEEYPDEVADLRVLHYMNAKYFDKESDLDTVGSIRDWLRDAPDDRLHERLGHMLHSSMAVLEACPWNRS